uniref:G_PROTEIN_RECEP_F1_2 domain-containing protein n=1 Tax=Caenorhabditis japonica TaxID=281687 RepID=A0A8R1HZG0_CAEJA
MQLNLTESKSNFRVIDISEMFSFTNQVYLGTYVLILILEICCAIINGLLIGMFYKLPTLRAKNLTLVYYLSVGDFITAITEAPYIIYMIKNWNPTLLDFDPLFIMIASIPLPIHLKISATITVGIALSRNIAIYFPATFRQINQTTYSSFTTIIGAILGVFDVILLFILSPIVRVPNCATSGCFVGHCFLYYWGISNMILGFLVFILSITLFFKIKSVRKHSTGSMQNRKKYNQANRISTGILTTSMFFLTVPSFCVGFLELIGFSVFRLVGPFYSAALMATGICNGIIFICFNTELRGMLTKGRKKWAPPVSAWSVVKSNKLTT